MFAQRMQTGKGSIGLVPYGMLHLGMGRGGRKEKEGKMREKGHDPKK